MSEKEFKVGDRVAIEDSQYSGVVTEICNGRCKVRYPSGRVMNFPVEVLEYRDDPKTAFLHDLSELLRKYNAVINASWDEYFDNGYPKIDLDISFNGHVEGICFENVLDNSLTADNVLNYDK